MAFESDEKLESGTRYTLTRAEVAARLGISMSSVRRLEWDKLHPEVDDRGVHRFDLEEVNGLRSGVRQRAPARVRDGRAASHSRQGRMAARVFLMFARHHTLRQIVVATKQPPEVIRGLYREWSTGLEEGEWARRSEAEG